jgi:DNA-binding MarR family transcriptional regulator
MPKSIYRLPFLGERTGNADRSYLDFLAGLDDHVEGTKKLERVSQPVKEHKRNYQGFNFFLEQHRKVMETIGRGEFLLVGCNNQDLRQLLHLTTTQASRILKRLRVHGLLRKLPHRYRYTLTELGRQVVAAGLKVRAMVLIPALQAAASNLAKNAQNSTRKDLLSR